jgi:hypothetical protein
MNFEGDDLDWALGELMHLTSQAKSAGVLPHLYSPALFAACRRVINAQPFEVAAPIHAIWLEMQPTVVYFNWYGRRANARTG